MTYKYFYRKKITQTEYRGGKYKKSFVREAQYLDMDLSKIEAEDDVKKKFKKSLKKAGQAGQSIDSCHRNCRTTESIDHL